MPEIIYGRNPVVEALRAKQPILQLYVLKGVKDQRLSEIEVRAARLKVPVSRVEKAKLLELASVEKTQGVVALLARGQETTLADLFAKARQKNEAPLIALLDGIEDPHNLGAILRSADAAGVHGVVLPRRRSASVGATVAKTSAGASAHVLRVSVSNMSSTIEQLKKTGNIWFVGADQTAEKKYTEIDLTGPTGLVIGGEGKGLHRLVRDKCDFLARIPMVGKVNSLNASVAAALLFFEARRQRAEKHE